MSQQTYNFWSRFLHRMALGSRAVAEVSFDFDRMMFPAALDDAVAGRHVFVTGLARAGTTILMRALHATGAFRSITYRDMPFVLAPNLWGRITGLSRKTMTAEERVHGDGILVDYESPEALEEVFWRVFSGDDYIRDDCLVPMQASPDQRKVFRAYVAALLRQHPGARYLSKNNNNILRLPSLFEAFPNAAVVVPFRNPLQQAHSLMQQHRGFVKRHGEDSFALDYMTWLVHHEFGLGHRPFGFDGHAPDLSDAGDPLNDLGYWLRIWLNAHNFIKKNAPRACLLVPYERLCADAATVWPALCEWLDLPADMPEAPFRASEKKIEARVSADLLAECMAVHDALRAREDWR